jgi:hypothetical protein
MDTPKGLAQMTAIPSLFLDSYQASRQRFMKSLDQVRALWPDVRHHQHHLSSHDDLTIDWFESRALEVNWKALIFTTGEHGIEGYVGSAMLQRFLDEHLARLNPKNTGLLLVHAINPWGMEQKRRTNANNVDLNRNFVYDPGTLDPTFNQDYARLDRVFNPAQPVRNLWASNARFAFGLSRFLPRKQWDRLRGIWLLGQYHQPRGIHYGSTQIEEETGVLMERYRDAFRTYERILHLDMHTGYGPRYQMSLVDSVYEARSSAELSAAFDYPLVLAANPDEFYAIHGDMIDYVYTLRDRDFPQKQLYSTSFEFGTFGATLSARLRTLRAMILENQSYWYGAVSENTKARVQREFQELFYPIEPEWRAKAVADADRAFRGILRAEGYAETTIH